MLAIRIAGLLAVALVLPSVAQARDAYVASDASDDVSVIDTDTNTVVGSPIGVGSIPVSVAITPDGAFAYVVNEDSDDVSVIDTATNQVVGSPITVGGFPRAIAITPNGDFAYVSNRDTDNLSVIDTTTNTVVGSPITVGDQPFGIATTPDGARAYVTNQNSDNVNVINTTTNLATGAIPVGDAPVDVAITTDGGGAYVANRDAGTISVIDTSTNQVVGSPTTVGTAPVGLTGTPDGADVYVANRLSDSVSVIDSATNAVTTTITVTDQPRGIAITPNQSPVPDLDAPTATETGTSTLFDASGSSDVDGEIASYLFAFGDGATVETPNPMRNYAYAEAGDYDATVTVDDGEGCPGFVFTGQTASCSGPSKVVSDTHEIEVTDPPPPPPFSLKFGLPNPQTSLEEIKFFVTCEGVSCDAAPSGSLRTRRPGHDWKKFSLSASPTHLVADVKTPLSLPIPSNASDAAERALDKGGKVKTKVTVLAISGERERQQEKKARVEP